MTLRDVQIAQQSAGVQITSLLQSVFPTSRFTAFGHKMSWRVTYIMFVNGDIQMLEIQKKTYNMKHTCNVND